MKRESSTIPVTIADLISLEALASIAAVPDCGFMHVDLLLPSTEHGMIRLFVDVKLFTDGSGAIEPYVRLPRIFIKLRIQKDK